MLHLQEKYVVSKTLTPGAVSFELVPNYRGFVQRLSPVTREELEENSRLFLLAERQRREGRAS